MTIDEIERLAKGGDSMLMKCSDVLALIAEVRALREISNPAGRAPAPSRSTDGGSMTKDHTEREMQDEHCKHNWIANSGSGGIPAFKPIRSVSPEPVMHVRCSLCGTRTWLSEVGWDRRYRRAKSAS